MNTGSKRLAFIFDSYCAGLLRDFINREGGCQNDLYGVYNSRVPTETFIYRPDLVRNTPDWMKRRTFYYQEVTGEVAASGGNEGAVSVLGAATALNPGTPVPAPNSCP